MLQLQSQSKSRYLYLGASIGLIVVLVGSFMFLGIFGSRPTDRSGLKDSFSEFIFSKPSTAGIDASIKTLSLKPHIAGSSINTEYGYKIKQMFSDLGLPETYAEEYPVLLSYPKHRNISIWNPSDNSTFYPTLFEKVIEDGSESPELVVPTYHGFSGSGNVSGPVVYANFGTLRDYQYLDFLGISLKGCIVIVRYGHGFRGDKCGMAAERGAVGCLIYSDPSDDGYLKGPTYPDGPWRPNDGVQRGSVWPGSGDPATPGWASTTKSPRLSMEEISDPTNRQLSWPLSKMPTQPISSDDALPFLKALKGTMQVPANMSGSTKWLTDGYFFGPSAAIATMNLEQDYQTRTITNVFGRIKGSVEPDRVVILGVHFDAWTYGAADPISGSASMIEVVRAFGAMYKRGWRPRRTILFASWDAEEYAMIGSTEFAELHFQALTNKLIAYINLDIAVSGAPMFVASGTPNMLEILKTATKLVSAPKSTSYIPHKADTVYDLWKMAGMDASGSSVLGSLGAGSDYAPFLQHLGVSSLYPVFINRTSYEYPEYHSRYDTYYYMHKFVDPDWEYHVAMTKVVALVGKAFADSFVIPYDYTSYAKYLLAGIDGLQALVTEMGPSIPISFKVLKESANKFAEIAEKTQNEAETIMKSKNPDPIALRMLNDRLFLTERAFLDYTGLPGQPWLRHIVYAPAKTDAYAGSMFPTISDAASQRKWNTVQEQIGYVSMFIDSASEVLKGASNWV